MQEGGREVRDTLSVALQNYLLGKQTICRSLQLNRERSPFLCARSGLSERSSSGLGKCSHFGLTPLEINLPRIKTKTGGALLSPGECVK